jgi:hypothetical protein
MAASGFGSFNTYLAATVGNDDPQAPDNVEGDIYWGCVTCDAGIPSKMIVDAYAKSGNPIQFRGIIQRSDWLSDKTCPAPASNPSGGEHRGYGVTMTFSRIEDGSSKTLMVSEKWIYPGYYETGGGSGDDRGWADGWDCDIMRSALYPIRPDTEGIPFQVLNPGVGDGGCGRPSNMSFGSAHSGGINCLNGDGSVRTVAYGIEQEVFNRYAHRSDGETFDLD